MCMEMNVLSTWYCLYYRQFFAIFAMNQVLRWPNRNGDCSSNEHTQEHAEAKHSNPVRTEEAHSHNTAVTSVALRLEAAISLKSLRRWMDSVLWENAASADIFRIKGVVHVSDSNKKYILQVRRFSFPSKAMLPNDAWLLFARAISCFRNARFTKVTTCKAQDGDRNQWQYQWIDARADKRQNSANDTRTAYPWHSLLFIAHVRFQTCRTHCVFNWVVSAICCSCTTYKAWQMFLSQMNRFAWTETIFILFAICMHICTIHVLLERV